MEPYIRTPSLISSTPISPLVSPHRSLCLSISTASLYPVSTCQMVWNSRHSVEPSLVRGRMQSSGLSAQSYTLARLRSHSTHGGIPFFVRKVRNDWHPFSPGEWHVKEVYTPGLPHPEGIWNYKMASGANLLSSFPLVYMAHMFAQVSEGGLMNYAFQTEVYLSEILKLFNHFDLESQSCLWIKCEFLFFGGAFFFTSGNVKSCPLMGAGIILIWCVDYSSFHFKRPSIRKRSLGVWGFNFLPRCSPDNSNKVFICWSENILCFLFKLF